MRPEDTKCSNYIVQNNVSLHYIEKCIHSKFYHHALLDTRIFLALGPIFIEDRLFIKCLKCFLLSPINFLRPNTLLFVRHFHSPLVQGITPPTPRGTDWDCKSNDYSGNLFVGESSGHTKEFFFGVVVCPARIPVSMFPLKTKTLPARQG